MTSTLPTPHHHDDAPLSPTLAAHVAASRARTPDAAQSDAAQVRLQGRVAAAQPARRVAWPRFVLATASCAAVVVLALALFGGELLVGERGAAFAAVQRHLRDFNTLRLEIDQQHGGDVLSRSTVRLDRNGSLRTDVDDGVSVVVDTQRGRVMTLLHAPRLALLQPLPPGPPADDALRWLAAIRDFQGRAEPLPPREIDGVTLPGWRLDSDGLRIDLWADDDGVPRRMAIGAEGEVVLDYRFVFDAPIAADALAAVVPPGYTEVEPDAD